MNILVTGATGLLGSNIIHAAMDREWSVAGTHHSQPSTLNAPSHKLDIRETRRFRRLLAHIRPDVVINCAAMTDVDACERHPDEAHAVNGTTPGDLAAVCNRYGTRFVQVSTDYVFDGNSGAPYDEDATPSPIQVYGESKLAGEQAVRDNHPGALVVRVAFLWGIHHGRDELAGFPAWVYDQADTGQSVPAFTDQRVTPTRAGTAANALLDLLESDATGRVHIAAREAVTPYEFARRLVGRDAVTEARRTALNRPATRPHDTRLDTSTAESLLGRQLPSLAEDMAALDADASFRLPSP